MIQLTTNLDLTTENQGILRLTQEMFEKRNMVPSKGDIIKLGRGVTVEVKEVKWEAIRTHTINTLQTTVYVGTPNGMTIAQFQENQEKQRY